MNDGMAPVRLGIDLGGTKIAITALDDADRDIFTAQIPTPRDNYEATIAAITGLVEEAESQLHRSGKLSIGVGMPGSISPATGRVQNANSTWLNGRLFHEDLTQALRRPVRLANDANCFALSEASDGAGRGAPSVFGVILGTGCGGGLVFNGRLVDGPRAIGGEWGHNPLPWPDAQDLPPPSCWCGCTGCIEGWVSGPALHKDYLRHGGHASAAADTIALVELVKAGDPVAKAALDRHALRLAKALAMVVNIFDPYVIVLGGGLSKLSHLYEALPRLMAPYIFADHAGGDIRPPVHGAASGVRGAARLWDET